MVADASLGANDGVPGTEYDLLHHLRARFLLPETLVEPQIRMRVRFRSVRIVSQLLLPRFTLVKELNGVARHNRIEQVWCQHANVLGMQ